jgi:hypothetical protein
LIEVLVLASLVPSSLIFLERLKAKCSSWEYTVRSSIWRIVSLEALQVLFSLFLSMYLLPMGECGTERAWAERGSDILPNQNPNLNTDLYHWPFESWKSDIMVSFPLQHSLTKM